MTAETALRFDAGVCEGHFPGRPIVPGFMLLAQAWASCAALASGAQRVAVGVRHARFRQTVAPGESLAMTAKSSGDIVRIDLRRGEASVADATFVMGALTDTPSLNRADFHEPVPAHERRAGNESRAARESRAGRDLTLAELNSLLPHRPPIRMVRTVEDDDAAGIDCMAAVSSDYSIVDGGRVTVLATVEAAAQAAAMWASLRAADGDRSGGPRMGYLVGIRDLVWTTPSVAADRPFRVSARLAAMAEPLTHYAIDVSLDGNRVLQGSIATVLAG